VRPVEARARHLVLDGIGQRFRGGVDPGRKRLRAAEPGHVDRQYVEVLLERREHRPPAPPGVPDPVKEDKRRPGAAAVVVEPHKRRF
jgi:hypothetical protein